MLKLMYNNSDKLSCLHLCSMERSGLAAVIEMDSEDTKGGISVEVLSKDNKKLKKRIHFHE